MSISERSVEGGNSDSSTVREDDHTPLWRYVQKIERMTGGGGNWRWLCSYCRKEYKSSYSRVKAHLLRVSGQGIVICQGVKSDHLNSMMRVIEQAELRLKNAQGRMVPLSSNPTLGYQGQGGSGGGTRVGSMIMGDAKKRRGNPVEKAFNVNAREELNAIIGRMFFSVGLPFNFARNPYYRMSYQFAAEHQLSGYVPPGYNTLRTTQLQLEKSHVENMLEPIKSTWREKGVSIVSDGWSDPQRRPLINFMAVTEGGPMFLGAVNAEGEYKDMHYISAKMLERINEVGPGNVVQVITDNAPVCRAAGQLVEGQYPHIFWTPCVVHTLNLALKNICSANDTESNAVIYEECKWITEISEDVQKIRTFIMNHSMRLALYNEHVKLKLLSVVETRFVSVVVMLRRVKIIKKGLQDMVICEKWNVYRSDDREKAQFVREKMLDELWWDKLDYILSFTEPIYDMLRAADTDKPCLHLVYDMWDTMIEKVKKVIYRQEGKRDDEDSSFFDVVHSILVSRWNKSNTPLHCLAHSLNPRYYSAKWLNESLTRVAPHMDDEISELRSQCLQRYFPDPDERREVTTEFGKFSGCIDVFSKADSVYDRGELEPKLWWVVYESSARRLQRLALRLLGQPSSSSCCERNWSTYSFIASLKRSKLLPSRADDLVFVHSNLRLLSRSTTEYHEGEGKMWDVGGDSFESFEGPGILEFANLSLDEPDLEVVIFNDVGRGERIQETSGSGSGGGVGVSTSGSGVGPCTS